MLTHEVARRLEQKLGLGQFPVVRRRLYARLQRTCEQKGDGPLLVIAGVLEEALGPKVRDKGQYFCWVVKRRLEEQGYWTAGEASVNQTRNQAKDLADAKAKVGKPVLDPATKGSAAEVERLKLSNELLKRALQEAQQKAERGVR